MGSYFIIVPVLILVPSFLTLIFYMKQSGEKLCKELSLLEGELEDSLTQSFECITDIQSVRPKLETEILILVITAPDNREFREQLRRESYLTHPWQYSYRPAYHLTYHFVVGAPADPRLLAELRSEAAREGDLLIGGFRDSYENLVYKTIWLLRYAVARYNFEYVIKVDDDTFINNHLLFDYLYKYSKPKFNDVGQSYYGGMIRHGPRDVQRDGQWGLGYWEFGPEVFPPYLVGGAYILNYKAARQIIDLNSRDIMVAFRIEDAYVGALADRLGILPRDIPKTYSKQYDRFCNDKNGRIFHRVAPSFQVKMIHNWTTLGYYCTKVKTLEQILEDDEEMLRKY